MEEMIDKLEELYEGSSAPQNGLKFIGECKTKITDVSSKWATLADQCKHLDSLYENTKTFNESFNQYLGNSNDKKTVLDGAVLEFLELYQWLAEISCKKLDGVLDNRTSLVDNEKQREEPTKTVAELLEELKKEVKAEVEALYKTICKRLEKEVKTLDKALGKLSEEEVKKLKKEILELLAKKPNSLNLDPSSNQTKVQPEQSLGSQQEESKQLDKTHISSLAKNPHSLNLKSSSDQTNVQPIESSVNKKEQDQKSIERSENKVYPSPNQTKVQPEQSLGSQQEESKQLDKTHISSLAKNPNSLLGQVNVQPKQSSVNQQKKVDPSLNQTKVQPEQFLGNNQGSGLEDRVIFIVTAFFVFVVSSVCIWFYSSMASKDTV